MLARPMSEVLPAISAQSAPSRDNRLLTFVPAERGDRQLAVPVLLMAVLWLAYTRFYFWLQPRHLTFDGGAFIWLFNKPDPGCGLTRTFAWTWRGDLWQAVWVYPLGPLLFVGTIFVVLYSFAVLIGGRAMRLSLSRSQWGVLIAVGVVALGMNWMAKLVWLGM